MGCIVSKLFLDFYIFFIFTRPLRRQNTEETRAQWSVKTKVFGNIIFVENYKSSTLG